MFNKEEYPTLRQIIKLLPEMYACVTEVLYINGKYETFGTRWIQEDGKLGKLKDIADDGLLNMPVIDLSIRPTSLHDLILRIDVRNDVYGK